MNKILTNNSNCTFRRDQNQMMEIEIGSTSYIFATKTVHSENIISLVNSSCLYISDCKNYSSRSLDSLLTMLLSLRESVRIYNKIDYDNLNHKEPVKGNYFNEVKVGFFKRMYVKF